MDLKVLQISKSRRLKLRLLIRARVDRPANVTRKLESVLGRTTYRCLSLIVQYLHVLGLESFPLSHRPTRPKCLAPNGPTRPTPQAEDGERACHIRQRHLFVFFFSCEPPVIDLWYELHREEVIMASRYRIRKIALSGILKCQVKVNQGSK